MFTCGKRLQTKDQQFIDSLQQYEFIEPKLSRPFTVQSIAKDDKVPASSYFHKLTNFQYLTLWYKAWHILMVLRDEL